MTRTAQEHIVAVIAGLIFGLGLVISGMSDPGKVLGFLTLTKPWDPSLIFVMGGGLCVAFVGYRLVWRRSSPVCSDTFHLPTNNKIDARLIVGSALFGLGWGIVGLCPGPAITLLGIKPIEALYFIGPMLFGLWLGGRIPLGQK